MDIFDDFDDVNQVSRNNERELKKMKFGVVEFIEKMTMNLKRNIQSQSSFDEKLGVGDLIATLTAYLDIVQNDNLKKIPELMSELLGELSEKIQTKTLDNSPTTNDDNQGDVSDFE